MPALARPRHEAFAQAILAGLAKHDYSQGKAYLQAGYKTTPEGARRSASRLLLFVDAISKRVAELQHEMARRKQVTVASIVDELEEARGVAQANDQASAMVAASTSKARILGLEVQRSEIGKPGDFTGAQSSSDIAELVLKDAGAESVPGDIRAMAVAELERHAAALASLAAACNAPASSNQA